MLLGCRLPRTVGAHVALLVPHLGCKAYPIRSGIVHALASLIAGGFDAPTDGSGASDAGAPWLPVTLKPAPCTLPPCTLARRRDRDRIQPAPAGRM